MSILWQPSGSLDVATDPSQLPEQAGENSVISGAMQRCKNLALERAGRIDTRPGSSAVSAVVLAAAPSFILVQSGVRYAFAGGEIYRNEIAIATGLTDAQWSAATYNQFNDTSEMVFACNGTDRKRIDNTTVYEWGIEAPTVAATLTAGASTGLTGTYYVKYTYVRKSGTTVVSESNPSPLSASQVLANQSLSVTVTASSDAQVTHIRVYRTIANGGEYYVDQDITAPGTVVDTNTADTALGSEAETDHDRPPTGAIVFGPLFNGVVFIAKDNPLYWCAAKRPEYWPVDNFIEVSAPAFPIRALASVDGQLYALTDNAIYFIQGISAGAFSPVDLQALTGAHNLFGALSVKGHGLYHVGHDGIYLLRGGVDRKITQTTFEPIFRGTATNGLQSVTNDDNRWLFQYENRVYFHYGNGNALVFNLDNERATYYKWDRAIVAPASDVLNERFIAGTSERLIRVMEDRSVTTDAGTSITWECQSKDYLLQTRRHFPRWVKYDVEGTATGEIYLDGTLLQSHSLTVSRNTDRRLIDTDNGRRCSIKLSGTGSVTIRMAELE